MMLAFLLACTPHAPVSDSPCTLMQLSPPHLSWTGIIGSYEFRDCTQAELDAMDEIQWTMSGGHRASGQLWRNVDSSTIFERLEGVTDLDALRASEGLDGVPLRPLPLAWPVHPDSPNQNRLQYPMPWWPEIREAYWVQRPEEMPECRYSRASGHMLAEVDGAVYLHTWNLQHFFPEGYCGG